MDSGAGAAEDAGGKIASVVGKARGIATGGGAKTSAGDTIRSGGGAGADVDGEIKFAVGLSDTACIEGLVVVDDGRAEGAPAAAPRTGNLF